MGLPVRRLPQAGEGVAAHQRVRRVAHQRLGLRGQQGRHTAQRRLDARSEVTTVVERVENRGLVVAEHRHARFRAGRVSQTRRVDGHLAGQGEPAIDAVEGKTQDRRRGEIGVRGRVDHLDFHVREVARVAR